VVHMCEATSGIHVNTENCSMNFLLVTKLCFVLFALLIFVKVEAQNCLHVQETLTRGMNHIKLRHGQQ
jgi:hypothetical protein